MNNLSHNASNATYLIKLDQYDLIAVNGEDALDFLHNQFTNDLKKLPNNMSSITSWCSVKGRVLYTLRIWPTAEGYLLLLPKNQTESFLKKLKMFVFRSKVTITVLEEQHVFGIFGHQADDVLSIEAELVENQVLLSDDQIIIKLPAPTSRYLLISSNRSPSFATSLVEESTKIDQWNLLDIETGLVEIQPETADLFLPQMLDLERLGGLSFQKGCYPGQEIVARVKYRGEVKKQLYRAQITSHENISAGTSLIHSTDNKEQVSGHIVNAVQSENPDQQSALVVINIKEAELANITVKDQPNATCSIQPLSEI